MVPFNATTAQLHEVSMLNFAYNHHLCQELRLPLLGIIRELLHCHLGTVSDFPLFDRDQNKRKINKLIVESISRLQNTYKSIS